MRYPLDAAAPIADYSLITIHCNSHKNMGPVLGFFDLGARQLGWPERVDSERHVAIILNDSVAREAWIDTHRQHFETFSNAKNHKRNLFPDSIRY